MKRHKKRDHKDAVQLLYEREAHLKSIPREIYAEIHDTLNDWEWHPALGDAPEGWDKMTYQEKRPYVEDWMSLIESQCSKKERLRYHHVHNLGRTEQQFEDWWDSEIMRRLTLLTGGLA